MQRDLLGLILLEALSLPLRGRRLHVNVRVERELKNLKYLSTLRIPRACLQGKPQDRRDESVELRDT
jgi:hypothetical protein